MKKFYKFSLLILLALFSLTSFANKVDVNKAKKLAENFYFERCVFSGTAVKSPEQLSLVYTQFNENVEMYYVFSAKKGFIIIAADDDVYPVLGYSFEGNFNSKNGSPEYSFWMKSYEKQIIYIKEHTIKATSEISDLWNNYTSASFSPQNMKSTAKSVEPLLMSTWDQGTYYNYLCPEDAAGPNGHVWTGCVATAMSQVMYYYRYPSHGTGNHGYTSSYGYLYADFANTTYNWDAMQNNISGKFNFDMAQLQSHCGIAIDMGYSASGSGAYMGDDVSAMINNFGYSSTTQLYNRNSYNDANWANLLIGNLDNKMPVQYSGFGDEGGHAFVCDGYQSTTYFHFNWGWSGAYNGYYYLSNLNPGYTFNNGQQAILNSYPATGFPQRCGTEQVLPFSYGTIEDGSSPKYNYQNNLDCYWLIAPSAMIDYIRIDFEKMATESGNDIVTIYNGPSTSDSVLGIFSGNSLPPEVISTSKKVLVRFTTNGTNVDDGWLLTYNAKPTSFCSNMLELTAASGTISDGSDTNNYNNDSFCHWRISLPEVSTISINFNSFNLANDEDFVKIYDETANLAVASYTEASPPQSLVVNTDKVLILFKTNSFNTASGWDLTYNSVPLSVQEIDHTSFIVYPNPAVDAITITANVASDGDASIELLNTLGETIMTVPSISVNGILSQTIDLKNISQGIYFLRISSNSFNHIQKLIIK